MADEPLLINLAGSVFLLSAETGGYIQSFQRQTTRKQVDVYDGSVGKTVGTVWHDPSATYNVRVIQSGTAGVLAASPGVTVSLTNPTTGNGVSTGGVYCQTTDLSHNAEALREFSITAIQRPAIT